MRYMYDLQNRWKIEGNKLVYYGLRNVPDLLHNEIKISYRQKRILSRLPCELTTDEIRDLKSLFKTQVVEISQKRKTPTSFKEAKFCTSCVANDFMIPGLEFDRNGKCPMCQTAKETEKLKSVVPIKNTFSRSKKSRFDVAVFYTGGKDSTYLLYYLSKVQNLRVLAMTWEIPYLSDSAKQSIENAKKTLKNVEFITRKISDSDLKKIYRKLYELSGNTCACPSLAYVLFYPEMVANRIPYFVVGNEPVQMLGLYYNHMAPKISYSFGDNKLMNVFFSIGRILTFRPPLKRGQFHTLATMKQLAYGDSFLKKISGYDNELVSNVVTSIKEVPEILKPLKHSIRSSSFTGNIPAFVQVDFDKVNGSKYDWKKVQEIIKNECGWVAPNKSEKGLHTSCNIEKCKEHTQFLRFYQMKTRMIPFSALEISLASRNKNVTRENALAELKESLGFTLNDIDECKTMQEYLES